MKNVNYREQNGKYIQEFEMLNQHGLHARPAALISRACGKYDLDISCSLNGKAVSGKSIMGLMTLEAHFGDRLLFEVSGLTLNRDGPIILEELANIFQKKFFEA